MLVLIHWVKYWIFFFFFFLRMFQYAFDDGSFIIKPIHQFVFSVCGIELQISYKSSETLPVELTGTHVLNFFFFIYYWVLLFILFLFSVITFSKFMGVVNSIVFLIARASNHIWRVSLYPLNFNTIAFAYNVMSYDSQRWLPISLNNINFHFNNPS